MIKRLIALLLAMMLLSLCACGKPKLNVDEDRAAKNVEKLINMMKDPDSFILRGDVIVIRDEETGDYYTYIDHSGNNSYGASVRSTAIFKNYSYLCDYDDEEYDDEEWDTYEERKEILAAQKERATARLKLAERNLTVAFSGNEPDGSVSVSGEKIAKYLDITHKD